MTLQQFAEKQYNEILENYAYTNKTVPISLDELTEYITEWALENEMTVEETVAEFRWDYLTMELGLGL